MDGFACQIRSAFSDALELVDDKQDGSDCNTAVCDIECRPVPSHGVYVQKIDDVTVQGAVDQIADGSAQNQCQRQAKQALVGMFFQQVHNDDDGQNADGREKVPLPSRLGCQKTEGGAFVITQNQVEKRRYPDGLAVMKDMGNPDLADLVEQDDCNGEDPFDCLKTSFDNMVKFGL